MNFKKGKKLPFILWAALTLVYSLLPMRYFKNPKGIDLSMTSYGQRIKFSILAVSSFMLFNGHIKNIYFSIDYDEKMDVLTRLIVGWLKLKGVIVYYGESLGPHSKYYNYLIKYNNGMKDFILIDDDVIYYPNTCRLLFSGIGKSCHNITLRSYLVQIDGDKFKPYNSWEINTHKGGSLNVFATNVGAVYIRQKFAHLLHSYDKQFLDYCQSADDIWFYWIAVKHNMPYFQVCDEFINPPVIPFTQKTALSLGVNVHANDQSLMLQFNASDVKKIENAIA